MNIFKKMAKNHMVEENGKTYLKIIGPIRGKLTKKQIESYPTVLRNGVLGMIGGIIAFRFILMGILPTQLPALFHNNPVLLPAILTGLIIHILRLRYTNRLPLHFSKPLDDVKNYLNKVKVFSIGGIVMGATLLTSPLMCDFVKGHQQLSELIPLIGLILFIAGGSALSIWHSIKKKLNK